MQEVDDLGQGLLGLVLPGHVGEGGLHVGISVDLGPAVAERKDIAARTHTGLEAPTRLSPEHVEDQSREDPHQQEVENRRILPGYDSCKGDLAVFVGALCLQEPVHQPGIIDCSGLIGCRFTLGVQGREIDLSVFDHDFPDQPAVHTFDKGTVIGCGDPSGIEHREDQTVQKQNDQNTPQDAGKGISVTGCRRLGFGFHASHKTEVFIWETKFLIFGQWREFDQTRRVSDISPNGSEFVEYDPKFYLCAGIFRKKGGIPEEGRHLRRREASRKEEDTPEGEKLLGRKTPQRGPPASRPGRPDTGCRVPGAEIPKCQSFGVPDIGTSEYRALKCRNAGMPGATKRPPPKKETE